MLEDVNRACPSPGLPVADIVGLQWGRLPLDRGVDGRPARLADRPRVAGPTELGLANLYAAETSSTPPHVWSRCGSWIGSPPRYPRRPALVGPPKCHWPARGSG